MSRRPEAFWRYCAEGGVDNLFRALGLAAFLIGRGERPAAAQPTPAAGFWPKEPAANDRPIVPILFYRARALGFDLAPVEAFARRAAGARTATAPHL